MPTMPTLYATKESYPRILEWGQNTAEEWYHPVSRRQFHSLSSVKKGDIIEFVLDGLSKEVQVLEVGKMCEYYLLKHVNGDFKMPDTFVENVIHVILVKRV
jgi:phosphoribosylformylglycinamidine (FGAM) synthase PurS component